MNALKFQRGLCSEAVKAALFRPMAQAMSGQHWAKQHQAATREGDGAFAPPFEQSILRTLASLAMYADAYAERYESPIGNDGVLGESWCEMVHGLRGLLNGDIGRLDGGTLDAAILALYKAAGFEGEL